jgi:hypothetical protein
MENDPMTGFYKTKSGILVKAIGPIELKDGSEKVPCIRVETGGWHGFLKISRLKEVEPPDEEPTTR